MKIGICGNMALDRLGAEINKNLPQSDIIFGSAGAFYKELSAPWGELSSLEIYVIALDWRCIVKDLYDYGHGDDTDAIIALFSGACDELRQCIEKYRTVCNAKIILFSPISEWSGPEGFITRLLIPSRFDLFSECQKRFNLLCQSIVDVYPVDMEEISSRIGKDNTFDRQNRLRTGYPFTTAMTSAIAVHLSSMCV